VWYCDRRNLSFCFLESKFKRISCSFFFFVARALLISAYRYTQLICISPCLCLVLIVFS
jgi:hypothetical protein